MENLSCQGTVCPISLSKLLYKMGQDFSYIQYICIKFYSINVRYTCMCKEFFFYFAKGFFSTNIHFAHATKKLIKK